MERLEFSAGPGMRIGKKPVSFFGTINSEEFIDKDGIKIDS
jgi:hypothetical protein